MISGGISDWRNGYTPQNPTTPLDISDLPDGAHMGVVEFEKTKTNLRGNTFTQSHNLGMESYDITLKMSNPNNFEIIFSYRDLRIILSTSESRKFTVTYRSNPIVCDCVDSEQYKNPQLYSIKEMSESHDLFSKIKPTIVSARTTGKNQRSQVINIADTISNIINPVVRDLLDFCQRNYANFEGN